MPPAPAHVVVFDVNVYLDAADLVGAPFTWDAAIQYLAQQQAVQPGGYQLASLRALAACTTGEFSLGQTLEVWTSDHIDDLVVRKASQPADPALAAEDRGLGWSRADALDLLPELVDKIIQQSCGGSLGAVVIPRGNPPLSHEDGLVLETAHSAAAADPICRRWCVTRDKKFLQARLPSHVRVVAPEQFLHVLRGARFRAAGVPRPAEVS